ncbi:MAG TPA: lysine 5,6-aminomutase subunit alpha [Candidatus Limnocylindrales bacterium]
MTFDPGADSGRVVDPGAVRHLRAVANSLAGAWAATARTRTTFGRERAVLGLLGVDGLDRAGRPLAAGVVERYVGESVERLARGIALPFAMAAVEYDLEPRELALDVASGAVDLALEAELLDDPERRAAAERHARSLAAAAVARIDANRTARRELLSVLGDPPRPWIAFDVLAADVAGAREEILARIRGGAELLRIAVPAGRELSDRLAVSNGEAAGGVQERRVEGPLDAAPAGSARGLNLLRDVVDRAAAERGGYVRLGTWSPALAGPEQAVVAAFDRLDAVRVDPIAEVVEASIDPDRALADHAAASLLHARAGSTVIVGAGPLAVAPDMMRGVPSDGATRAGRALALQALAVGLLHHHGVGDDQIAIDTIPDWLADERDPFATAMAQVVLRRAVHPGAWLAFVEPPAESSVTDAWPFIVAAVLPQAGRTSHVLRRGRDDHDAAVRDIERVTARIAARTKGAVAVAAESVRSIETSVGGRAAALASASLRAAIETLEAIDRRGWSAVLGTAPGQSGGSESAAASRRIAADAVVEMTDAFDPFTAVAASVPATG